MTIEILTHATFCCILYDNPFCIYFSKEGDLLLNHFLSLSSFNFIKRLFASSFSAIRLVSSAYLRLLIFPPAINQIRSVAQSCPTLCDPMNRSTPGLPVHHQLLEFPQTHVHRVSDAIQPSHPLSFPSPLAPNPSQHQSLFQ